MDPFTSFILALTIGAVFLYALYGVIKRAVSAGVRDALEKRAKDVSREESGDEAPRVQLDD